MTTRTRTMPPTCHTDCGLVNDPRARGTVLIRSCRINNADHTVNDRTGSPAINERYFRVDEPCHTCGTIDERIWWFARRPYCPPCFADRVGVDTVNP